MRTLPGTISTMTTGRHFTLARCVKIRLRDGTVYGFTDLDEDVTVPESIYTGASLTYVSGQGVVPTDISLSAGLDAGSTELVIPIGTVSRIDVLGRRFNQAKVWIFDIDHSQRNPEPMPIMRGWITEARVEEGRAIFEVRDLNDLWNVTVGGILTPRCRADFGDTQCGLTPESTVGIVSAVTDDMHFTLSIAGLYANQYFRFGTIEFTSGALSGVPRREIVNYTGATGAVEMFDPLPDQPAVGDAFTIYRGCSRLKSSTDASVPTCLSYGNVNRFRGFDRVPGSDAYLKIAIPGGA